MPEKENQIQLPIFVVLNILEELMNNQISLREMKVGQQGRISRVDAKGETNQRIRDMGLIPGTVVTVVGKAPLRDPVALRLSGVTISLRNNEADYIKMELPN